MKFVVHHGDCLVVMRTMPDSSVDSIVTDPPYGLSFMGKRWDYDVPAVEVWAECLRVLKPGGHMLAFAGTRTQHRMAVRIEDAGFEIRDMIAWVYGCLSDDSEVLTREGWEHYHTARHKEILAYDPQADVYQWERPSRWSEYRVESDTAYRIKSDQTDQIVSRGHRCLVERGGMLAFVPADELAGVERVPYLQGDVSALSQGRGELLLADLLRQGEGLAEATLGERQGEKTSRQRACGGEKPSMEGRADLLQAQREVSGSGDQVCALPGEHDEHGPQGRVCDGASPCCGVGNQQATDAAGMRASHQPRCDGQQAGKPDAVCNQCGSQAVRARASYQTTVATVTAIEYSGLIWCPTVSTGAFVARRNGKVFITGNSGFPKSHNGEWGGTALKPALETVTFASKPYTAEQERDIILSNLIRLEARLWLLSSVSAAGKNSTSNQSEYGAACAIAQWSAEKITNTQAALCDPMGTSLFELATNTSLSIVSSWRRTLAESLNDGRTSTIATKSSTTIDWRTLRFSLSQITPESIIKACSLPGGFSANATTAESHFNASLLLLQSIRTLSATDPAISQEAENCRGADVKPNLDPCIMARKPLVGTVAANVQEYGTGALNIDGCRITTEEDLNGGAYAKNGGRSESQSLHGGSGMNVAGKTAGTDFVQPAGRWPANLIHDGSDEVVALFPQSSGGGFPREVVRSNRGGEFCQRFTDESRPQRVNMGDAGSAARFFYCAKASKRDRDEGLDGFAAKFSPTMGNGIGGKEHDPETATPKKNIHPTVKPTDLMRYLCRLVTPPGGTVLDPFTGSGSTGKAAVLEGFRFVGIEREAEYVEIARARIDFAVKGNDIPQGDLFEVNP